MARTNAAAVELVLTPGNDFKAGADLTPFIDAASSLVDDVVECAADKDLILSDAKLEVIERWLAAHFYVMSDQVYASKSTGGASASFQGQTGMMLEASKYGQTAIMIDRSNCLTNFSKDQVAGGFWMGKPPSDQVPYEQRD